MDFNRRAIELAGTVVPIERILSWRRMKVDNSLVVRLIDSSLIYVTDSDDADSAQNALDHLFQILPTSS